MESYTAFWDKKMDQFLEELKTDCEHWYFYTSNQNDTAQGLTHYLQGLSFARIAYMNRVVREFNHSLNIYLEKRIEAYLQMTMHQAKQTWPT